ncbi:MAG: radical SAM protein [Deltaproteobacteria bacterium]|nr:radical SAM protein [Deltaproteobacteria bacterium]
MDMTILLLNPPGTRRYIRDNYCSKTAQAAYSYAPVDLLLASGRFRDVLLIDAIVEDISPRRCLDRIVRLHPQGIISLVSSVSWLEDRSFLEDVKRRLPQTYILATGDVLLEGGMEIMAGNFWLDGIILDFTNRDALNYFNGDYEKIVRMIYRTKGGEVISKSGPRPDGLIHGLDRPRQEMFLNLPYLYPFVRQRRFATVQTDYGCHFKCRFCSFASLGHQWRPLQEIMGELLWLRRQGIKEIYFNDQTFGGSPHRLRALCRSIKKAQLDLNWCCWCRVDLAADHLAMIKDAGCHTLMLGVETANEETLARMGKRMDRETVKDVFSRCRGLGLRTLATFILGLPGEDPDDITRTIEWALELNPDFVSFNVLIPRKGSALRGELAVGGLLPAAEPPLDQSGGICAFTWGNMELSELRDLRSQAFRRFYLRPAHWFRLLKMVRTFYDFKVLLHMGSTMSWHSVTKA